MPGTAPGASRSTRVRGGVKLFLPEKYINFEKLPDFYWNFSRRFRGGAWCLWLGGKLNLEIRYYLVAYKVIAANAKREFLREVQGPELRSLGGVQRQLPGLVQGANPWKYHHFRLFRGCNESKLKTFHDIVVRHHVLIKVRFGGGGKTI